MEHRNETIKRTKRTWTGQFHRSGMDLTNYAPRAVSPPDLDPVARRGWLVAAIRLLYGRTRRAGYCAYLWQVERAERIRPALSPPGAFSIPLYRRHGARTH